MSTQNMSRKYSIDSLDLMRAMKLREKNKGEQVSSSGEMFAILRAIGFSRKDRMNIQQQAREFYEGVKEKLIRSKRTTPSSDEVISVMRSLGYHRELAN